MRALVWLFLFCLGGMLSPFSAYADIFTVTSNTDDGVGSLRQALKDAAANGQAISDRIEFNLPDHSEAGRTIILLSQLPAVSSNLKIDGSTQGGAFFGQSSAKVKLLTNFTFVAANAGLYLFGVQDVEIYGLYIKNELPFPSGSNIFYWKGVHVINSKNITIGASGKGNVIVGFNVNIAFNLNDTGGQQVRYSEDVSIKANFISVEPDGVTLSPNLNSQSSNFTCVYGQFTIGGTETEGNLFPLGLVINQQNTSNSTNPADIASTLPANILIRNNKVGVDFAVTQGFAVSNGIRIGTVTPGGKNDVLIEENVISSQKSQGIFVINNGRPVKIRRNFIGTDKTRTKKLPMGDSGIFIYWTDGVEVGSSDPADANYITNCKPIDVWPYSTVAVNKNSFYCTTGLYPMIFNTTGTKPYPVVKILALTSNSVSGIANPNSTIELFYSDQCGTCSPETYFATTITDGSGKWSYTGNIVGSVIASATLNGVTSEFTRVAIDVSKVTIHQACNGSGGSITGIIPENTSEVIWTNENGTVVGNTVDLINVPPGKYRLQAKNGVCNIYSSVFEIKTSTATIVSQNVIKKDPSCGNANGSITGLSINSNLAGSPAYSWKDAGGVQRGTALDLSNAAAGSYTLTVTYPGSTCLFTYGPVILQNTSGPNIGQSAMLITGSNCGSSSGSVRNITAMGTGNLQFRWLRSDGTEVGHALDLSGQPAGVYKLIVSDQSNCQPLSTEIVIPEINGINLIDNGITTKSSCSSADGSISGIMITGASSYRWFDASGNEVRRTSGPDIDLLPAGRYYLVASNAICERQSKIYTIESYSNTDKYVQLVLIKQPACGLANGSLQVSFSGTAPVSIRWAKKEDANFGSNSLMVNNLEEGTYELYGSNASGCETLIDEYTVVALPQLNLDDSTVQLTDDVCQTSKGSITGVKVSGHAPFTYKWSDGSGNTIGSLPDLINISSGTYTLTVTDGSLCQKTQIYSIGGQSKAIPKPEVKGIQICLGQNAVISVVNPDVESVYRLYDSETTSIPLDEQKSGVFNIAVKSDQRFYVSRVTGTCESDKQVVEVSVGTTGITVPNVFTPNGDGINDLWEIKGLENFSTVKVKVYNRLGETVYESFNNSSSFNGTYRGRLLPAGSYYFIINIGTRCGVVSGSVTLLR